MDPELGRASILSWGFPKTAEERSWDWLPAPHAHWGLPVNESSRPPRPVASYPHLTPFLPLQLPELT